MNKYLNFGGNPVHRLDTGIVFQIHHCWEIRKLVNRHSFILIRQMAALVRRALTEVCTVPVLLVIVVYLLFLVFFVFVLQFVIDVSNRHQVAAATVQLLEILTDVQLQSSYVLIILNKRLVLCKICHFAKALDIVLLYVGY